MSHGLAGLALDVLAPRPLSGDTTVFGSISPCLDRCWAVTKSLGSQSPWPPATLMPDKWELPFCAQCGDLEFFLGTAVMQ